MWKRFSFSARMPCPDSCTSASDLTGRTQATMVAPGAWLCGCVRHCAVRPLRVLRPHSCRGRRVHPPRS